ncbi:MAG: diaminopimelate epimerase [Desulfotomaculum sp.]|nr:diaminopimelate epimerase [Desulfotomaculum sp.]
MYFTKVHGLGNDFIIVNCLKGEEITSDLKQLAINACHRKFGIGADGLVLLRPSEAADLRMQILNSDGSEAEMCGNAIRCVAKYVYDHGIVNKEKITVETLAGIIIPEVIVEDGAVSMVRVDMGEPKLERGEIPMKGPEGKVINEQLKVSGELYNITAVSMGNPHCIIFIPKVEEIVLEDIGPKIEKHPVFPQKTNVEFVQVLNRQEVRMRVWERGAGITMACGTGACATAVAGVLNGYTDRKVTVHLDGGPLIIEWDKDNRIYMTGPAAEVFSGEYIVYKR